MEETPVGAGVVLVGISLSCGLQIAGAVVLGYLIVIASSYLVGLFTKDKV